MSNASITQPTRYQGNTESTKYINKVEFDATGAIKVTAIPIVKDTLLAEPAAPTTKPQTNNQIVNQTRVTPVSAKTAPVTTITDPQGIVIVPQPPGPGTR